MPDPVIPDQDFITLWRAEGPAAIARKFNLNMRAIYYRRRRIEEKHNIRLDTPNPDKAHNAPVYHAHSERAVVDVNNGIVLVGGDLHAWPGNKPTAFRAFLKFCKKYAPAVVVMNGDVIDGASISRHPPIGWEKLPTLIEEIEVAQEWLNDVVFAVPKATKLFWSLGNHDARFSTRLAVAAPEFAKVHGVRLQDHFGERWVPCWSAWINGTVVIKHRGRGGIHATHTNAVMSGKTMVTNHLHSLKVTPFNDYSPETRFGVDAGCLADSYGPQFKYLEDGFRNWRSGFAFLTFKDGKLLWPELVAVVDDKTVQFRGEYITV